MIRSKIFVDNLVKTSNSAEGLTWLYQECSRRMDEAHFELRSCNTNNEELKEKMVQDGRFITHGCDLDKILGYKYSPGSDVMKISEVKIDQNVNTKRLILSVI